MANSPVWKVYDANNKYQGATKDIVAASVLAQWYGNGASVRFNHARKDTIYTQLGNLVPDYDRLTSEDIERFRNPYEWSAEEIEEAVA